MEDGWGAFFGIGGSNKQSPASDVGSPGYEPEDGFALVYSAGSSEGSVLPSSSHHRMRNLLVGGGDSPPSSPPPATVDAGTTVFVEAAAPTPSNAELLDMVRKIQAENKELRSEVDQLKVVGPSTVPTDVGGSPREVGEVGQSRARRGNERAAMSAAALENLTTLMPGARPPMLGAGGPRQGVDGGGPALMGRIGVAMSGLGAVEGDRSSTGSASTAPSTSVGVAASRNPNLRRLLGARAGAEGGPGSHLGRGVWGWLCRGYAGVCCCRLGFNNAEDSCCSVNLVEDDLFFDSGPAIFGCG